VIAVLVGRVLGVSHKTSAADSIVVAPLEATDLGFPAGGGDREFHDGLRRDLGSPAATREISFESGELIRCRTPRAAAWLADESQLATGIARLLDDLRA